MDSRFSLLVDLLLPQKQKALVQANERLKKVFLWLFYVICQDPNAKGISFSIIDEKLVLEEIALKIFAFKICNHARFRRITHYIILYMRSMSWMEGFPFICFEFIS